MKRKFLILSLLSVFVIALGIAVPAYMNREQPTLIGGPFHTPRPTSTRFSEPLTEIVEVVEVDELPPETSDVVTNCTYPLYYWKDYRDSWPSQIIIAGMVYTREDMVEIYNTEDPDTATLLVKQLYTAFLNILGGASHVRIDPVIVDANNWLEGNPPGSAVSELNQQIGLNLATGLEDYNNGLNGPPPCEDVPPTPTPSATATATPPVTETSTPSPTNRRLLIPPSGEQPQSNNQPAPPGAPFQPTAAPGFPTATVAQPTTGIPSPTLQLAPPTAAPTLTPRTILPTATRFIFPSPPTATYTPRPPTSTLAPLPTSTLAPLPTSTYTPLPADTDTPVPPPTDTDTPVPPPTNTPEPTATEPIPTRNPHFTPSPTTPVDTPNPDPGGEETDLNQELLSLSQLLETVLSTLGGT